MKKISVLILCLVVLLSCTISAHASNNPAKIVDKADVLSTTQEEKLQLQAEKLVEQYDIDVVIVTVDSLGSKTATAYADDFFDYNGYGVGTKDSGVLFLLSMEYRDWAISTHGDAIRALTDYGIDTLFDSISEDLADNDFYSAFTSYLNELDVYFKAYEDGDPIDRKITFFDLIPGIFFGLLVGSITAAIIIWIMTRSMNTARAQNSAQSYVTPGSFDLQIQRDIFLYSRTSRVRRAQNRSGGSSTHRSSSGRRHGGRSGKF